MDYPTLEQVNVGTQFEICKWHRFLPSPGRCAVGMEDFDKVCEEQRVILDRIEERFAEFGGMTTEISKTLGWTQ